MSQRPRKRQLDLSQDTEDRISRNREVTPDTKRRRLLPSPSTSCSTKPKKLEYVSPSRPLIPKKASSAPGSLETGQQVKAHVEDDHQDQVATPLAAKTRTERNHSFEQGDIISDHRLTASWELADKGEGAPGDSPIEYWASTGHWPSNFATMTNERGRSPTKRSRPSSYSQSYKDGSVPRAHSQAYEQILAENGVYMRELEGRSKITKESRALCMQLLQSRHEEPQHTAFALSDFMLVWQRAQNRNEARVYRDITPLLIPSPELLWINGAQDLEHVVEEINVEWSKCKTLGGPKPKPDLAIGIAASAFDDEEIAKLKNYSTSERPTMFTDNLYFPFLLCEVKCGNEGINIADRQNMHSSSLAVKAIVELHKAIDEKQAAQLSGQVLVLSVSHDNERVKIYGHFAVLEQDRTTFYRYPVASFVLNFDESQGWRRTHDFVHAIYQSWLPRHLKRIRNMLVSIEDPRNRSISSNMSVEESASQEVTPSAHSSQEVTPSAHLSQEVTDFKKPDAPASKKPKGQVALLQEQLMEQQRQSREQLAEQQRQSREQFAEQQRQNGKQMEILERQLEEQRKQNEDQSRMLRQLLERQ